MAAPEKLLKFIRYTSIEPVRPGDVEREHETAPDNDVWVATEKVHGCNFGFIFDGTTMNTTKRSSHLPSDSKFHGFHAIVAKYGDCVRRLRDAILAERELADCGQLVHIYGELFGGLYPHPDLPKCGRADPNSGPVQKGVYYCPHKDFYAFDVVFDNTILDYDHAARLFEQSGFFYARQISRGTLAQLLALPVVFESTIPGRLGLPPIPDNAAEGLVIRRVAEMPVYSKFHSIYKRKHPKFLETAAAAAVSSAPPPPPPPSDNVLRLGEELVRYLTRNRLVAVLSKDGDLTLSQLARKTKPNRMRMAHLVALDAIAEYDRDITAAHDDRLPTFISLDKASRARVMQMIMETIDTLLKQWCADGN